MVTPKFGTVKSFYKNQIIFKEGQTGDVGYLVRTGEVSIFKIIHDEKKILAQLGPGEVFGEMGLINNSPRTAYAQANDFCDLVIIDKETLQQLLKKSPKMIQSIAVLLMKRLANTLHLLEDDAAHQVQPRHFLSICRLLDIIAKADEMIDYHPFCKRASEITLLLPGQVEHILARLSQLNLIEFDEISANHPQLHLNAAFKVCVDKNHLIRTAKAMAKAKG